jgi:hypothetical protein
MRSQLAVTVVTSSPVCLYLLEHLDQVRYSAQLLNAYAMMPERASRSMKMVPSRMCPEEFRYVSSSHGS